MYLFLNGKLITFQNNGAEAIILAIHFFNNIFYNFKFKILFLTCENHAANDNIRNS